MKTSVKVTLIVTAVLIVTASVSGWAWFFRSAQSYVANGNSMSPTLKEGDRFIAVNYEYTPNSAKLPQRGDIVIVEMPDGSGKTFIKRVIGLPGDVVEGKKGTVYVNGERLAESYVRTAGSDDFGPETIPAADVWVMGDNRPVSLDSRHLGPLQLASVRAVVTSTVTPGN